MILYLLVRPKLVQTISVGSGACIIDISLSLTLCLMFGADIKGKKYCLIFPKMVVFKFMI